MPRGDGTGPNGRGPLTGKRLGQCAGNDRSDFMGQGYRGGFGRGLGFGRGFRQGFGNTDPANARNVPGETISESKITTLIEQLSALVKKLSKKEE